MSRYVLVFIVLLAVSCGSVCAESMVYKCRGPDGNLVYQESPCRQSGQEISSWASSTTPAARDNEEESTPDDIYVIKQQRNGHYFLDGKVNGKELTFVVDTGASAVSLPRSFAFLARISCIEQIQVATAAGTASACTAQISTLKFGPFMMRNVRAIISPNLDQPLLGMNVLNRFKIEQNNGEMRISKHD